MNDKGLRLLEFPAIQARLVQLAQTVLGKELAQTLTPSTDPDVVRRRLAETEEARLVLAAGKSVPLGLRDLRPHLARAAAGAWLDPGDLLDVADTIATGRRLVAMWAEAREVAPRLSELAQSLRPPGSVEDAIRAAISDRGEVRDDASPDLGRIRKRLRVVQARVRERLEGMLRGEAARFLQDPIITLRNDRYVVPVRQEHRQAVPGIVHDQSSSGQTLFVEPMAVVELNNDLRRLALAEREEIERILRALSGLVGQAAPALRTLLEIGAEIDLACAKGRLALEMRGERPEIDGERAVLRLRQARHPLLGAAAVPIDLDLGQGVQTLVITGPNTGGKTVALKTAGMLAAMAQAGLHLPAAPGSRLGVFDHIEADIGDEQSIAQSLSTFSSHLTRIVAILEAVGPGSLVLLDEVGAGTDPVEGAALATAILEALHARGALTVATTHYAELKQFAYTRPGVMNASVEFDVETLRPTYRLLLGAPGRSNAFAIARRLGLPEPIVARAEELSAGRREGFEDLILAIQRDREAAAEERAKAGAARGELERAREEADAIRRRLAGERAEIAARYRRQAEELLARLRQELEVAIEALRHLDQAADARTRAEAVRAARQRLSEAHEETSRAFAAEAEGASEPVGPPPSELAPGDRVRVRSLGLEAVVLSSPREGQVELQVGAMRLFRPLEDLQQLGRPGAGAGRARRAGPGAGGDPAPGTAALARQKAQEVSAEVMLRGMRVEEALERLDRYLDDALLAGFEHVRIIHGKGTGTLRQAVAQYLRQHPQVASFRLGEAGEGGEGATVANLRSLEA